MENGQTNDDDDSVPNGSSQIDFDVHLLMLLLLLLVLFLLIALFTLYCVVSSFFSLLR